MSDLDHRISALSKEKRQLLEILRRRDAGRAGQEGPRTEPFSLLSAEDRHRLPDGLEDAYPLTMVQLGMLFHMQQTPDKSTPTYHNVNSLHIKMPFDARVFQAAVDHCVAQHESYRVAFDLINYREPLQLIHRSARLQVKVVDLRHLAPAERQRELDRFVRLENTRLVELSRPPLVRYHVHRRTDDTFQFTLTEPHALSDGWSTNSSLVDLVLTYQTMLRGERPAPAPALGTNYADFVALEREALRSPEFRAFWSRKLADYPIIPLPRWPAHLRPAAREQKPTVDVPWPVVEGLMRLQRLAEVPFKSITLAAHLKVMSMLSGRDEVVTGLTTNGRLEVPGGDRVRGLFLNTLPLRFSLPPGNWIDLVKAALAAETELMRYRRFPLSELQRMRGGQVLFESGFSSLHFHQFEQVVGGVEVILGGEDDRSVTHFPLAATFQRMLPTGLSLTLEINDPELSGEQASDFHGYYRRVMEAMAFEPFQPHRHQCFLRDKEQHQLLVQWNPPARELASGRCLPQLFEEGAARHPDAVAVSFEDRNLTYGELDRRSARLAGRLRRSGVGPEVLVGLCLERSPEMLVAILGILKAGGAYVPMDPAYPKARLGYLIADSGAPVLVTERRLLDTLPEHGAEVICLEDAEGPAAGGGAFATEVGADNPAYVIYTSGSTGQPKGVVVTHRHVARLFAATEEDFAFTSSDVWTLFHSFAFDFSVWEIWGALLYGGRLVVVPYWKSRSPEAFCRLLAEERVTFLNQTPSAFRQLIRAEESVAKPGQLALSRVVFGGEALDLKSLRPWFERHGESRPRLVNMYGITETTVHVTYRPLRHADLEHDLGSAIGGPIADLRLCALDPHLQPVPVGVGGELHVGGGGLARGYLHRPALTAERFIPDPFGKPGSRAYRSGDLARYLPDGGIEYLGRSDHQVKIRGFRIEPGEVSGALVEHPLVRESAVLAREDTPGEPRLVAYVVPQRSEEPPAIADLRSFLDRRLPDHLVPAAFVLLDELPLTAHGKLDRQALPLPDTSRPDLEVAYVAPRNPREEALAAIWAEVLGLERVGVHDNFFSLGGDSIVSIRVIARAGQQQLDLSIQDLFQHPTVAELAAALAEESASAGLPAGEARPRTAPFELVAPEDLPRLPEGLEDAYPLSRLQAGMLFHMEMTSDSPLYHNVESYHLRGRFELEPFEEAVRRVVARHAVLRTSFDLRTFSEPLQLVHRQAVATIEVDDLRDLEAAEQDRRLLSFFEAENHRPFDLSRAPQLRFHIGLKSADSFQFSFTENHAIFDGWSLHSTLTEIFSHYTALLRGETVAEEPPPPIPFRDFIAAERAALASEEAKSFWAEKLRDLSPPVLFPWRSGTAEVGGPNVHTREVFLSEELSVRLQRFAQEAGIPVKHVLMAAHLKVLSLICGQNDLVTGLTTNGRAEEMGGEETRGLFLNTLPLRVRLPAGNWADVARAALAGEQELLPYRLYPLSDLQRDLGVEELFQTTFNYTHFHVNESIVQAEQIFLLGYRKSTETNFPLVAAFSQDTASHWLVLEVSCAVDALPREQLGAIMGYYQRALEQMAAEPLGRHEAVCLLSPGERHQVLVEWTTPATTVASDATIPEMFAAHAAAAPESIALVTGSRQLSYRQLDRQANRLAHHLAALGVAVGTPVGVAVERSIEMVIAWLAILKAGGAYVPLDPSYPADRLAWMLADSRVPLLLCEESGLATFAELAAETSGPRGAAGGTARLLVLERLRERLAGESPRDLAAGTGPDDLANVIYTSGSTGRPKGVAVRHRGVARLVRGANPVRLRRGEVLLTLSSVAFDASTMEIWGALLNGARLAIMDRGTPSLAQVGAAIERHRVTSISFTAGLFHQLVDAEPRSLSGIRRLIAGGDVVSASHVRRHLEGSPGSVVLHCYGPTESTVLTAFDTLRAPREVLSPLPIGRPLEATSVRVLDGGLRPSAVGVAGELFTGGAGLARGYYHRPGRTAELFLPDPFSDRPGSRMYRIGDRARFRTDGRLEFLGRRDQQVKVRGFRIELEEIEAVLGLQPGVRRSAVVVRQLPRGDKILVAYVVPAEAEAEAEDQALGARLRASLGEQLPDYMIPTAWVAMSELPLTAHGKLNRRALPDPDLLRTELSREYVAPRTPTEELVAGMMAEVLSLERVGAGDSFFELGGHSLLATQLVSRLRQALAVELPLRSLFESPTVSALAERVEVARLSAEGSAVPPIEPVPRDSDLELSFGQERLWFLDQLDPGNAAYHVPIVLRLNGELNHAAMAASLRQIVRRHEVLRTVFERTFLPSGETSAPGDGEGLSGVWQRILPEVAVELPVVDLAALPSSGRDAIASRLATAEVLRPFDLARGPLLRLLLLRLDERRHVAVFTIHHVAADGWSMGILVREVVAFYGALCAGEAAALPPLPIQYADFARWQRNWLRGEVLEAQLAYWVEQLAGLPAVLELPTDRPRPPVQSFRGRSQGFIWDEDLLLALEAFSRKRSATLFMTLLASLETLLYRVTGKSDFAVGTPIAGRGRIETEDLIGLFINTLVVRSSVLGELPFEDLLAQVREAALGAYAHQDLPFEKLVDALQPERSLSFNPLFQVMFALQNAAVSQLELPGLSVLPFEYEESAVQFDLELAMGEEAGRLAGSLKYATDLFDRTTVQRLLRHLESLIREALRDPSRAVSELPLLAAPERQQLMVEWNDHRQAFPETSFPQRFAAQAAATPEAVAAACGDVWLSYGELEERSRHLARRLAAEGVGTDCRVALLAERGLDFLTVTVAVLRAGGAWLPLDPLHPAPRIAQVLARGETSLLLFARDFAPRLETVVRQLPAERAPRWLILEDLLAAVPAAGGVPEADLPPPAGPGQLAYVIFTSGSTGVPKGAMVEHRGMINHLQAKIGDLALGDGDVVAQTASQCFDISVWQFLAALLVGGRLEIFGDETAHDPPRLLAAVERRGVTILETVPSLMGFVLEEVERQAEQAPDFGALRWLIPTGEALPPELCRRWLARYPEVPLLNAYGPTECSDDVTHHAIAAAPGAGVLNVPIGRPVMNLGLHVLDRALRPVPIGVAGQLCVAGPGVGRGYSNDGRRTAEVFLPDPYGGGRGERLYATGDLARHLAGGVLEFLGRLDHQVKIRGFRIELGEIEAVLASHPQIGQAAVVVHRDEDHPTRSAGPRLVAYAACRARLVTTAMLRNFLLRELPDYMVPAAFVILEELPLTASGKVDRKALPAPERDDLQREAPFVAPRTATEEMVASLWGDLLDVPQVSAEDDFFDLGGHSLLAIRLTSRFRDVFEVEVPLRDVFEAPTVAGMAVRIERAIAEGQGLAAPPIVAVPRDQDLPLSFAQQRLWFIDQLEPGSAAYSIPMAFQLEGELDVSVLGAAFTEVVRRHESLRTTFTTVDGRPVQVIAPPAPVAIPRIDLRHHPRRQQLKRQLTNAEARRPFDLAAGPLLRVTLLWLEDDCHAVILNMHHTVSDGWSIDILLREVAALMTAHRQGERPRLPELPIQYADYAHWQRQWMAGEVLDVQLDYWGQQVEGVPVLDLPTDRPRPAVQTFRGTTTPPMVLSPELTGRLRALSRRHNVTLFMTLLAGFSTLLARVTGQRDFLVGTPTAGRTRVEVEDLIGFFINTVVLRARLGGNPDVGELLARVRESAIGASAYQELPFERLVDAVQPERDMSRNPLFQVMFGLQNVERAAPQIPGLVISGLGVETGTAKFDLNLQMSEQPQVLSGAIEYNSDLFDRTTAIRLVERLEVLFESMVERPDGKAWELPVLTAGERHQLLGEWNDTEQRSAPGPALIHQLFEANAARTPAAIAALCGERQLSYGELEARANRLAHHLRSLGVGAGEMVAVYLPRCLEMVPALLGILKAGGGYLPLEIDFPRDRIRFMLDSLGVRVALVLGEHLTAASELAAEVASLEHLVCLDPVAPEAAAADVPGLRVHTAEHLAARPADAPVAVATPDDVAYVIFTSGSTGKPKGVVVRHRPVLNLIRWVNGAFGVGASDRVLFVTSLCFDLSVYDVFGLLAAGGSIRVVDRRELRDPDRLVRLLSEEPITYWDSAPAALRQLVPFFPPEPAADSRLRLVFLSGDWIPVSLPDRVRTAFPGARVISLGGATEATVWSNVFPVEEVGEHWVSIPYGRPITNARYHVLDGIEPCPIGVPGALYIGGGCLASGYAQAPALTAAQFVPDPWGDAGAVLYATGDQARYLADGNIEFLGRLDFQVKIRGFRIELGEIETVLAQHPEIREAVVLARDDGAGAPAGAAGRNQRLVAYVVPSDGSMPGLGELRDYLQSKLPEYMLPAAFVTLDELPVTANGKLDRRALPAPEAVRPELESTFLAPTNAAEELLAGIWSELLGVDRVGIHDNFFELGGDSILSIQIISRAAQRGLRLTARQVFQYQTIAELVEVAGSAPELSAEQGLVLGEVPLLPVQQWFFDMDLPAPHHWNQALLFQVRDRFEPVLLGGVVDALLVHHDALRLSFDRSEEGWRQEIGRPVPGRAFATVDLSALGGEAKRSALEAAASAVQAGLELASGDLVRVVLFAMGGGEADRLLAVVHHLAIDGVSWRILLQDLQTAYAQALAGEAIELPEKTTSFKEWAERLTHHARSQAVAAELPFWAAGTEHPPALPVDLPGDGPSTFRRENLVADQTEVSVWLEAEETRALLQEVPPVYRTQINDVLLTGLVQAFAGWTGSPALRIDLEGHGREEFADDLDVSRTVGWFTAIYPVLLDLGGTPGPGGALKAVKEQLRAVPEQGIGYGLLRYLGSEEARAALRALPPAEVSFNYMGQLDQALPEETPFVMARENGGRSEDPRQPRPYLIDVGASVMGGRMQLTLSYGRRIHRRSSIERVAEAYRDALRALVDHCRQSEAGGFTPSDFPLAGLGQDRLDLLATDRSGIVDRSIEDIYPLTPLQEGLLFHTLEAPGSGVYVQQLSATLQGDFDAEAFEQAWQRVVGLHPIFRTSFVWEDLERPLQVVRQGTRVPVVQLDWRQVPAEQQAARLRSYFEEDRLRGFDVAHGPLLRLHLIRLAERAWRFCWTHHHMVIDGWSMPLVIDQVLGAYGALGAGEDLALERPRPYRDYIAWLEERSLDEAETYWRESLAGFTSPTALAIDPGQHPGREPRYEEIEVLISLDDTMELEAAARGHQLTLNTLVQGAWALLLARYSGEEDIVFGTTVAGRPADLAGVESMVGLFINTLPVRVRVPRRTEILGWLKELQDQQAEMRQYEYTPLVAVQGWSEVPRGTPLFETVMVFENYPVSETPEGGAGGGGLGIAEPDFVVTTNYPLMLVAKPDRELPLSLRYDVDRFEAATIRQMLDQLRFLLGEMAVDPRRPIESFSLVTSEARALLPDAAAVLDRPRHELVTESLASWVRRAPERPAIRHGEHTFTYGELARRSDQLARALRRRGLEHGATAAVLAPRSFGLIAAMFGVLKAGGALLALDRELPPARKRLMLEQAGCGFLLYAGEPRDEDAWLFEVPSLQVLPLDALTARPAEAVAEGDLPLPELSAEDPAYVFFTSGTTGTPKAVAGWHGALAHFLAWQRETFAVDAGDRAAQLTGLSFDVVLRDIFLPLTGGALLTLPPEGADLGADRILPWLEREAVTLIHTVPSVVRSWLADVPPGVGLAALRCAFFAGEPLTDALVGRWRAAFPAAGEIVNLYGPTETTLAKCFYRVPAEPPPGVQPIGVALPQTQALILSSEGRLCGVGEPGEIVLRTPFRSRGYLNDPQESRRRFVTNPTLSEDDPDDLVYLTGDRGCYRTDGSLAILGRLDDQVKIRGVRVEPGEVGAALEELPRVAAAAVLARPHDGRTELVAYVVPAEGGGDEAELRADLGERLPPALVPAAFVFLDALPLTPNGKLDRRALPEPRWRDRRTLLFEAPRNPIEEMVAEIWAEVLGLHQVGVHDDFFELGGHSLLATQVLSRLRRLFRVELELRDLFEATRPSTLADRVQAARAGGEGLQAPPLVAVDGDRDGWLPLSFAQQRIWFLEQLDPGSPSYNIFTPVWLHGPIDPRLVERGLNEIARRHESLRTAFGMAHGKPAQRIVPPRPFPLPLVDLSALGEPVRRAEALRLAREEAAQPFDLTRPRQQRTRLLRLTGEEHIFLLTMHHIISDAWSLGIVVRELATLYGAYVAGAPSPLPELTVQYADFADWQREWFSGEVLEGQLAYWKEQLAGAPGGLDLPFDRPRPPLQTFRGERLPTTLPAALSQELRALGRPRAASLFMTLMAAFDTLLARYSGERDVVIGSPIASRNRVEIEPLIGFFVNTLVLRTDLGDDPDFLTLIDRVRDLSLDAFGHQDLPFEQLVEHLQPERELSRHPMFQVVFVLQNVPFERGGDDSPVRMSSLQVDEGTAKFDLTLIVHDEGGGLATEWEYNTDLFDRTTVLRMQQHYRNLLAAAAARPDRRVSELAMLSPGETHQLLRTWNVPQPTLPAAAALPTAGATLHGLFEARAERTPGAIAVVLGAERLTYAELDGRAEGVAHRLRELGVGPESLVALCAERSLEMVVGILAILKAGGAYVPLDPAYPAERLDFMLADSGARVILTQERLAARFGDGAPEVLCLDDPQVFTTTAAAGSRRVPLDPESPAYVIYTSGSTGRPKGVVVTHANVTRLFAATEHWFDFSDSDVWTLFHSYAFDFSVWEIWGAWLYGGRLVVVPHEVSRNPAAFYELLCDEGVTILNQTPSAFRQLLAAVTAGAEEAPRESAVRRVIFGGEALDLTSLIPWFERRGDLSPRLINMYGITETTVHVTYRPIGAADAAAGRGSLIGAAIPDLALTVLDPALGPVPIGVAGELYVGGAGLARGYLARPALTAERFGPDPWSSLPGARLYRTGDLARYRGDGDLEYLGRIDHQIKIRGFRIELGEIEAALSEIAAVREAVVVARESEAGARRLVAFVVPRGEEAPSVNELRRLLGERLPEYMVPAQFVTLEALPLTPSGKVNRRALDAPEVERLQLEEAYEPPRTALEELLAGIWAEVLEVERVGIDDSFFALGGDSMLSLTIVSKAQEAGVDFPLQEIYRYQTVRELAAALEAGAGDLTGFLEPAAADDEEELARMLDEIEGLSAEELSERLEDS